MDSQQNNLIIFGSAGLLVLILLIFGITGAKSDVPQAGVPNLTLDNVPSVSADDNTRGDADARVKLIEYSDIECPYCQQYHEELLDLTEREPLANFSWTYRHFPLTRMHADAQGYAVATECAADQGQFDQYLDSLVNQVRDGAKLDNVALSSLAGQSGMDSNLFTQCLDSDGTLAKVIEETRQAADAGATGTPFSVFEFDRDVTNADLETIQGLFGASTALVLSDDKRKLAIGGAIGATQIRDMVNLIVDPAVDQVITPESEGTDE